MKTITLSVVFMLLCSVFSFAGKRIKAQVNDKPVTYCNPLNLNYRFQILSESVGVREAADPVVEFFKGDYYLFASKSSGYWYSKDMNIWNHVCITEDVMPIEDYAPAIFTHGDYIYFVGSTHGSATLFRSKEPKEGKWEKVKDIMSYWDPAFLVEGDKLYLYYGCSPVDPIYGTVLDLNTLEQSDIIVACFNSKQDMYGWERPGEFNELTRRPYVEGAWMTKHDGKYYLQYATPGTEWSSYADGVYVSENPLGPFNYMGNSPVSYKPTGFITGAGHGCLFMVGDKYWKVATNAICVRHMFERRISMFPAGFDTDGYLYTNTYLGDYPLYLPTLVMGKERPEWNLLSYNKPVKASSNLSDFVAQRAVDENSRTAWVASSASSDEWFEVDLKKQCDITAIQVNFDEEGSTYKGKDVNSYQSYIIEASNDEKNWYTVVDKSDKKTDAPHDYIEFKKPFGARYLRIKNIEFTSAPYFSLRDFRVFGIADENVPEEVTEFKAVRNANDRCIVGLSWNGVENCDGYIVRYGIAPDKLYNNFQVKQGNTTLSINSLNKDETYYFTIESFGENGVSAPSKSYTDN